MDILEAIGKLRPGTAWTKMIDGTIYQAIDGTSRVNLPTPQEIQEVLDAEIALQKPPVDPVKERVDWQSAKAKGTTDAVTFLATKLGLE